MILSPEQIWETDMGYACGLDLRCRVIEAVEGGLSARGAAARFSVAGKSGRPPGKIKPSSHSALSQRPG